MKRRGFLYLIFMIYFSSAGIFAKGNLSEKISVSKVKVFLDEEEITEETEKVQADGKIRYSTIMSYTKFRENKKFSEKQLQKETESTRLRLIDSGLFYSAEVEVRESRKNPGTMVIYISVRTGFLLRFGGGNAYGFFGKAALGGRRNNLTGYLGYNKSGASYLDENTFGLPLILGASAFTNLPQSLAQKKPLTFDTFVKAGVFMTPDLKLGADLKTLFTVNEEPFADFILSPFLCDTVWFSEKLVMKSELRFYNYFSDDWKGNSVEAAVNIDYSPFMKITLAGLLSGGAVINQKDKEDQTVKINLEKSALTLCDGLGLANRGIRSGYTAEELKVDCYGLFSAEIRWNAFDFILANCFPVTFTPYLFTDLALAKNYEDDGQDFLDAYGAGLLISFECPVFAYFNFSYGLNHEGKGRFVFAAMQSF